MVRTPKAPLCKGSCHGSAVTEGLRSCALRKNSELRPPIADALVSCVGGGVPDAPLAGSAEKTKTAAEARIPPPAAIEII